MIDSTLRTEHVDGVGPPTRTWPKRVVFVAVWTFLGLVFSSSRYIEDRSLGWNTSVSDALAFGMVTWYTFALLAIPLVRFARRFPITRSTIWSRIPLYLGASIIFSSAHTAITHILWFERAGPSFLLEPAFRVRLVSHYHLNFLIFLAIVGFEIVERHYRLARERELERSRLETLLARTQLEALRAQLRPHFLFNSLNTVASLIYENPDAAHETLTGVADLLRIALERTESEEIRLEDELAFVRGYARLQMARFHDRLSFEADLEDDILDALLPSLILQPLVENAIVYGIAPYDKRGSVRVIAERVGDRLRLRVEDTGPGIRSDERLVEGIGLSNARERLQRLYGDQQQMRLSNRCGGGLVVEIVIPYHTQRGGDGAAE